MKNLADILKKSSDQPGSMDVPPSELKLHTGVYFIENDIDVAATLVSLFLLMHCCC